MSGNNLLHPDCTKHVNAMLADVSQQINLQVDKVQQLDKGTVSALQAKACKQARLEAKGQSSNAAALDVEVYQLIARAVDKKLQDVEKVAAELSDKALRLVAQYSKERQRPAIARHDAAQSEPLVAALETAGSNVATVRVDEAMRAAFEWVENDNADVLLDVYLYAPRDNFKPGHSR